MQRTLRKIKQSLLTDIYAKLCQTGSLPGKFYGTKVYRLTTNDTVEELPLLHITLNLNTATYQLARYLAKILSNQNLLQYTCRE